MADHAWEVFQRHTQRPRNPTPGLTISRRRSLYINRAAVEALGDPNSVTLAFDFDLRLLRVTPVGDCRLEANRYSRRIAAGDFRQWAGIPDPDVGRHFTAVVEDGPALLIDMSGEGRLVTSNRAKKKGSA